MLQSIRLGFVLLGCLVMIGLHGQEIVPFTIESNEEGIDPIRGNILLTFNGWENVGNQTYRAISDFLEVKATVKAYGIGAVKAAGCNLRISQNNPLMGPAYGEFVENGSTVQFLLDENFTGTRLYFSINLQRDGNCPYRLRKNELSAGVNIQQETVTAVEGGDDPKNPEPESNPEPVLSKRKTRSTLKPDLTPDPVKLAWEQAQRKGTKAAYEAFLDQHTGTCGIYCALAQQEIDRWAPLSWNEIPTEEPGEEWFEIHDQSSSSLGPTDIAFDESQVELVGLDSGNKETVIKLRRLPGADTITIVVSDPEKRAGFKRLEFRLGTALIFTSDTLNTDQFALVIEEGTPKYQLQFVHLTHGTKRSKTLDENKWPSGWNREETEEVVVWRVPQAVLQEWLLQYPGPGAYEVTLRDGNGIKRDIQTSYIVTPPGLPISLEAMIGIGAVAVLLIIGITVRGRNKARQAKDAREKAREERRKQMAEALPPIEETRAETEISVSEKLDIPMTQIGAPRDEGPTETGFSIAKRKGKERQQVFSLLQDPGSFYELKMSELWESSKISSIHMHRSAISELDLFLRTYNTSKINENESSIPEIGGMLVGTYQKTGTEYAVTVDKFIPIQSEFQNVYQLEFSAESIGKDLGMIQDEHPDLQLVGWFHTHPGHGLFLSKPDLRIQEGFFRKPYQFAMEIDSLSGKLDTGFFTWKKDGEINNSKRSIAESEWFAWTEIEEFVRTR